MARWMALVLRVLPSGMALQSRMFFALPAPFALIIGAAAARFAEDIPTSSDEADRKSLLNMRSFHFLEFGDP